MITKFNNQRRHVKCFSYIAALIISILIMPSCSVNNDNVESNLTVNEEAATATPSTFAPDMSREPITSDIEKAETETTSEHITETSTTTSAFKTEASPASQKPESSVPITSVVDKPTTTVGQKNALSSAKSYLSFMAFSYDGLIEQLEYEGYTNSEAVYAADNCGADWNEQAIKSAKSYISTMSFSYDGLVEQLEYEGFTHAQAVYGAEANGL